MKWLKLLLFLLFCAYLSADVQPIEELLNQQENLLDNLSNLMLMKQQEIQHWKSLSIQREKEMKSLEESSELRNQNSMDILNRKDLEVKMKNELLKASAISLVKKQTLSKDLKRDINSLERTLKLKEFWNRISIAVLIAMSLVITILIIIVVRRK